MVLRKDGRRKGSKGSNEATRAQNEHDKELWEGNFSEESGVRFRCWRRGEGDSQRDGRRRGEKKLPEKRGRDVEVKHIYRHAQCITSR
jgi:hypothetical protein